MQILSHTSNRKTVAEVLADEIVITDAETALDLLGNIYYQNFDALILHEKNLTPDFFNLKTGIAGEILQKFSNYRIRLAIVGDFAPYQSKSIRDFIFESNKQGHINFVDSVEKALLKVTR
ncbi:MAG TPA: DUF4180 domain-containing protein [Dyadobacter sp.]|jgi:hypothetical protein|nr:DUF4180 domain-containing protein [Dyadobacter sp.]